MNDWKNNIRRDIEQLSFAYLERNPDNPKEFIRTYWAGNEAMNRLISLVGSQKELSRREGYMEAVESIPDYLPDFEYQLGEPYRELKQSLRSRLLPKDE